MRKRNYVALVILLACFLSAGAAEVRADDPFTKLGRGLENIGTAPLELWIQTAAYDGGGNAFAQRTGGFFAGVVMTVTRVVVGVYDTVTFFIPFPANYEPVILPATPREAWEQI